MSTRQFYTMSEIGVVRWTGGNLQEIEQTFNEYGFDILDEKYNFRRGPENTLMFNWYTDCFFASAISTDISNRAVSTVHYDAQIVCGIDHFLVFRKGRKHSTHVFACDERALFRTWGILVDDKPFIPSYQHKQDISDHMPALLSYLQNQFHCIKFRCITLFKEWQRYDNFCVSFPDIENYFFIKNNTLYKIKNHDRAEGGDIQKAYLVCEGDCEGKFLKKTYKDGLYRRHVCGVWSDPSEKARYRWEPFDFICGLEKQCSHTWFDFFI